MSENTMIYGKVPPHDKELEKAVLGAIMLEEDRRKQAMEILTTPEIFHSTENRAVFSAIKEMSEAGRQVDLLTVRDHLAQQGTLQDVGGAFYLTSLTEMVSSTAHAITHAAIITEKWKQREAIRIYGSATGEIYKLGIGELDGRIAETEKEIAQVMEAGTLSTAVHISSPLKANIDRIEALRGRKVKLIGIETGLSDLNRMTNGWQAPDLIILAARPSQGKTALALNFALSCALSGKGVYIQSLEMGKEQLSNRLLATRSDVDMEVLTNAELSDTQFQTVINTANDLSRLKIHIDDKAAMTVKKLHNNVRRAMKKQDIRLVIVDYLQLMGVPSPKGKSRENVVSEISRDLKIMAKELNLPIIALSQMNRSIDSSKDRKPNLSDLRESGAIEQDADIVIFIHHSFENGATKNELVISKNRNGKTGDIEVKFYGANQRWTDVSSGFPELERFNPYAGLPGRQNFNDEPF